MDFYSQDTYSLQDIENLIKNEVEENIHLDYKAAGALSKDDGKKREITKDVSAFANSDGGIIVYGVSEKENKPIEISPIDGKTFSKEWLENVIQSIQPRIEDIKIYPIRVEKDINKSIYVVKIPRSENAPHMALDHRYYRRYNFKSVQMEDFEIRDLYNRVSTPKLTINRCHFDKVDEDNKEVTYYLQASIINKGNKVCDSYKLNFYINNVSCCSGLSHESFDIRNLITNMGGNRAKLSYCSQAPIYPSEQLDMGRFRISVQKQYDELFYGNLVIQMILFHAGGNEEVAYVPSTDEFIEERDEILQKLQDNILNISID